MSTVQHKNQNLLRRFIESYSPSDFFHRYELFKFFTLIFLLGVFTSIGISAINMQMITTGFTITQFVNLYLGKFLPRFWLLYHRWYLLAVAAVFLLFRFSLLKEFFLMKIEFIIPPKLLDPYVARKFARINNTLLYVLVIYMVLVAIPVLHLFNLNFYTVATAFTTLILSFLYNNYLQLSKTKEGFEQPLSTHTFAGVSYKSASGGPFSEELKDELRRYQLLKSETPVGGDVLDFAAKSKDNKFKGFTDLFNQLEKLFDPTGTNSGNLVDKIYLHNKTSDAIAHAIEIVAGREDKKDTAVIYSDAEFLHVKLALRTFRTVLQKSKTENPPEDFAYQVKAEKFILDDSFSEEKYARGIAKKIKQLHDQDPGIKKFCIVMTHVYYQTGRILQVKTVIEKVKEQYNKVSGGRDIKDEDFKLVYIVDGAQAVGNIFIDPAVTAACHFYAVCSHKWLLGHYSMGILLRNDEALTASGINPFESNVNNTPAEQQYTNRHQLAKSIPFETYVSTSIMLSDINHHGMERIAAHNRALSRSFVKGLYDLNNIYTVVNTDCECGIVTIRVNSGQTAKSVNKQLANLYSITGDVFEPDGVEDKSSLLRFSFHYFMGDRDVNKLLYALLDVAYENEN